MTRLSDWRQDELMKSQLSSMTWWEARVQMKGHADRTCARLVSSSPISSKSLADVSFNSEQILQFCGNLIVQGYSLVFPIRLLFWHSLSGERTVLQIYINTCIAHQNITLHCMINMKYCCLLCLALVLAQVTCFGPAQYNKTYSKYLDAYSAITHCNEEQISTWKCKLCQSVETPQALAFYYNKPANILGYSGYIKSLNTMLIVWRGTIDARNWVQDFTFAQVDFAGCRGCRLHEGFFLSYETLARQVKQTVQKNMKEFPSAKIVVIGSSMGAGLAVMNGLDFIENGFDVSELHLFGCPRVLNSNLAQFISLKIPTIWRVIHNRDIIPHVPLLQQNYHHPAFEVLYDEKLQNYRICDQSGEDPSCALSLEPGVSIQDHITYWYAPVKQDLCTI